MTDHRAAERGLYDRLQLSENAEARELLERLLSDKANTYGQICVVLNSSGLFTDLKNVQPQDLSRYRQRRSRAESHASVMALIESEGEVLLGAAAKHPGGLVAGYLRTILAEHAINRFSAEMETIGVVDVSREAARHALVDQRDRKLDLDAERLQLEERRLELQGRQQELAKDKFGVASETWKFILGWLLKNEPAIADTVTRRSDDLLIDLETFIEAHG